MIESPDISREAFAQMANDKLHLRESVKNAVTTETQRVDTDTRRKDLRSPPWTAFPKLFLDSRRSEPRVHVYRDIKVLYCFPEDVILLGIIM